MAELVWRCGRCHCNRAKCSTKCKLYREHGPKQTNADRIRAMTDEELAVLLDDGFPQSVCNYECYDNEVLKCKECILKWLKKEVDDGKS